MKTLVIIGVLLSTVAWGADINEPEAQASVAPPKPASTCNSGCQSMGSGRQVCSTHCWYYERNTLHETITTWTSMKSFGRAKASVE